MRSLALLVLVSCAPCPQPTYLQALVFQDEAGAALAPLRVDDVGTGERFECIASESTTHVACEGNRMTLRRLTTTSIELRAESVTGLKYEGRVTPEIIVPEEKPECWAPTLGDVVLTLK